MGNENTWRNLIDLVYAYIATVFDISSQLTERKMIKAIDTLYKN